MLALLHILTIKSDFICVNYVRLFPSEKIHAILAKNIDNQNIVTCNSSSTSQLLQFVYPETSSLVFQRWNEM
jgi:hypothetical protein